MTADERRKRSAEKRRRSLDGRTTEQRVCKIRVNSPTTEFEIHAFLYIGLKAFGWQVRGEIGTTCKTARFDLVVMADGKPVRLIEVKKSIQKGKATGAGQAREYARFGLPVDLVIGMEHAEEYLDHVKTTGTLPPPKYHHEKPDWQVRQECAELERIMAVQDLPPEDVVIVTEELFMAGARKTGRHSARQLQRLGVQWPLRKGWMHQVIGKAFPKEDYEQFMRLRDDS